jgi:vitamin B12 transporter
VSFFLPTTATLTVGGTYEKEHEQSSNGGGPVGGTETQTDSFDASRHTVAYYSELLGNPDERFSYTLSGRVDDNSDYHRFATYRVGANAGVVPWIRLRASLSTAFNAPAFNELRPTLFTVGSPDLRPEQSRSAEVGIVTSFHPELLRFSATYFAQRFSDLIQFVNGAPPDFKGSFANLTGATSNGYETELAVTPTNAWRGSASFTIMNPRVTEIPAGYPGEDRAGDALLRRPTHSGSFVLAYHRPAGIALGVAVNYVGKRPDLDFNQFPSPRVTLSSYTKLDLSADLPLASVGRGGVTLNARLENALNKRYEEVLNFAAPGRTILIGARASTLF